MLTNKKKNGCSVYKLIPLLWNLKHSIHEDRNKKSNARKYISTKLNHDKSDVTTNDFLVKHLVKH